MSKIIKQIKKEMLIVVPAIIYFAITFNLVHFVTGLMLPAHDARYYSYLSVSIGALLMGKVVLIVENLPFINALSHRPLIESISWKMLIYTFFIVLIRLAESWFNLFFIYRDKTVGLKIFLELTSPLFWATQLWVCLFLFFYVAFKEFTRVLGKDKMKQILFGHVKNS